MAQLLTIADLHDPNNDWQSLLPHIAWLGDLHEKVRAQYNPRRSVVVDIGNGETREAGIHASELTGCLRSAMYTLLGASRSAASNVNMLMRFDLGSAAHALLQSDFEMMAGCTGGGLTFEKEVKINPSLQPLAAQYQYYSSCDGLFTFFGPNGAPYIRILIEIKTMSKDEWEKNNSPTDKHVQQGTFYQKLLDAPLIWYIYYNKSNSLITRPTAPWIVPFNDRVWAGLEQKSVQLHTLKAQSQMPEREEDLPCTWCPYTKLCEPKTLALRTRSSSSKYPRSRKLR